MRKKFRSRKHIDVKFLNYLVIIFVLLFLGIFLRFILSVKIFDVDVLSLIKYSNISSSIDLDKLVMGVMSKLVGVDINRPNTILRSVMFYQSSNDSSYYYVVNDVDSSNVIDINVEPLVYIYNSHDTEEYSDGYTVFDASFYLQDRLSEHGVKSIVEENRTSKIRDDNGWKYGYSYKASRINLEKVKSENPSIKVFIDLHRDSVSRKYTSVTIGDKEFAKVLFVVGQEHANYLDNLFFTQSIDDVIVRNYPTLSKGILQKSGYGVNGIYNQDVGYNVILMEVGGNENNSTEVKNTLDVMANVIGEKVNE